MLISFIKMDIFEEHKKELKDIQADILKCISQIDFYDNWLSNTSNVNRSELGPYYSKKCERLYKSYTELFKIVYDGKKA